MRFSHTRFQEVWQGLDEEVRGEICAKARWEGRSLSSVMRVWWPDLWRRISA